MVVVQVVRVMEEQVSILSEDALRLRKRKGLRNWALVSRDIVFLNFSLLVMSRSFPLDRIFSFILASSFLPITNYH